MWGPCRQDWSVSRQGPSSPPHLQHRYLLKKSHHYHHHGLMYQLVSLRRTRRTSAIVNKRCFPNIEWVLLWYISCRRKADVPYMWRKRLHWSKLQKSEAENPENKTNRRSWVGLSPQAGARHLSGVLSLIIHCNLRTWNIGELAGKNVFGQTILNPPVHGVHTGRLHLHQNLAFLRFGHRHIYILHQPHAISSCYKQQQQVQTTETFYMNSCDFLI